MKTMNVIAVSYNPYRTVRQCLAIEENAWQYYVSTLNDPVLQSLLQDAKGSDGELLSNGTYEVRVTHVVDVESDFHGYSVDLVFSERIHCMEHALCELSQADGISVLHHTQNYKGGDVDEARTEKSFLVAYDKAVSALRNMKF